MTQTFTINQDFTNNLLKRIAIRLIKVYAVVLIILILPNITNRGKTGTSIGVMICAVIVMLIFTMTIGYKKGKKMYNSFQIIIDDKGIEYKNPMAPYKAIDWNEAAYIEKKNGDIKVYNKTVSSISRWWTGTGVIFIPREINDRDQLLMFLYNRVDKF